MLSKMRKVMALLLLAGCCATDARNGSQCNQIDGSECGASSAKQKEAIRGLSDDRKCALLKLDGPIEVSVQREILDMLMTDDDPKVRGAARRLVTDQELISEYILSAEKSKASLAKWMCGLLHSDSHRKNVIERCTTSEVAVHSAIGIADDRVMDAVLNGSKGTVIKAVVGDTMMMQNNDKNDSSALEAQKKDCALRIRMDEQIDNCISYARIFSKSKRTPPARFTFVGKRSEATGGMLRIRVEGVGRQMTVEAPATTGVENADTGSLLEVSGELELLEQDLIRLRNPTCKAVLSQTDKY